MKTKEEMIQQVKEYFFKYSYVTHRMQFDLNNEDVIYECFKAAAARGKNTEIVDNLLNLHEEGKINLSEELISKAFICSIDYNNIEIAEKFIDFVKDPLHREKIVRINNDEPLKRAISNGNMQIIDKLLTFIKDPLEKAQIITENNYLIFRKAASQGNVKIMDKLLKIVSDPQARQQMLYPLDLVSGYGSAFTEAARYGHVDVIDKLVKLTPDPIIKKQMIHIHDDRAFMLAASEGQIEVVIKIAAEVNDISIVKKICNKFLKDAHKAIKINNSSELKANLKAIEPLLDNPKLLLNIGLMRKSLNKEGWSSEQINEINQFVKAIQPMIRASKDAIQNMDSMPKQMMFEVMRNIPKNAQGNSFNLSTWQVEKIYDALKFDEHSKSASKKSVFIQEESFLLRLTGSNTKAQGLEEKLNIKQGKALEIIEKIRELNKIKVELEKLIDKDPTSITQKNDSKVRLYKEFDKHIENMCSIGSFSKETINRFKVFTETLAKEQEKNPNKSILNNLLEMIQNIFKSKEEKQLDKSVKQAFNIHDKNSLNEAKKGLKEILNDTEKLSSTLSTSNKGNKSLKSRN